MLLNKTTFMRIVFLLAATLLLFSFIPKKLKLKPADLDVLVGGRWTGKLTYLDYSSNKKTTILSNLVVEKSNESRTWYFRNEYPNEPKANQTDTIALSKDGSIIDGETLTDISRASDGGIKFITEKSVLDNGIERLYRFTYMISKTRFSVKKEEQRKGKDDFLERNVYEYTRP